MSAPTAEDFRRELRSLLEGAHARGKSQLEVTGRELHIAAGGYPPEPGKNHHMPLCCDVMYREMRSDDDYVVFAPAKGKGPRLKICYKLPRPSSTSS